MGLRVNNNIAALNAYRNLSVTDGQMSKSLEKLSSGFRINRAADDAAGLAISEGLRSQIGGLKVAVRNTQDGISVVQTAEGALTETHSILQRMRDLSVQASNTGGINTDARQHPVGDRPAEVRAGPDRDTTTFNGKKLLDGSFQAAFQVGANAGETIGVNIGSPVRDGRHGSGCLAVSTSPGPARSRRCRRCRQGSTATRLPPPPCSPSARSWATRHTDGTRRGRWPRTRSSTGTISFGGKTFDLSSVDYSTATTARHGPAPLNAAAKAALGLTTARPVPGRSRPPAVTFKVARGRHRLHRRGGCGHRRRRRAARRSPPPPRPSRRPAVLRRDHGDRRRHQEGLHHSRRPGCDPEPVRPHHQQPQRRGREPDRLGEPHPRRRHGAGDGPVHPEPDPVPGRHRDARAGQPGLAGCPAAAALTSVG